MIKGKIVGLKHERMSTISFIVLDNGYEIPCDWRMGISICEDLEGTEVEYDEQNYMFVPVMEEE